MVRAFGTGTVHHCPRKDKGPFHATSPKAPYTVTATTKSAKDIQIPLTSSGKNVPLACKR